MPYEVTFWEEFLHEEFGLTEVYITRKRSVGAVMGARRFCFYFLRMYNETSDSSAFNMLAVMLFLLQDYYEYGAYTNTQDIIESNGAGDILWDKTINH